VEFAFLAHIGRLSYPSISAIFKTRGSEMAAKVKPVQPTEIKDKKIVREVIEQIRKPIPASKPSA
jgi:hypothetical protein